MAFNFPLMPRMFMAIRREQCWPVIEIMDRLPSVPAGCQWATFLRNHDELTLEMVTDEERDYMYREYAQDPRMRLNLGIRRRLAPLVDGDRKQAELLHAMLFSLPGSPVLYYGDEILMGDNVYLGDRTGVRTPMQWNGDRNAGFSRADPSRLYCGVIQDPLYHYQARNVEASLRSTKSFLMWLRRIIRVRKSYPAFGRGTLRFVSCENRRVIAYLREYEGQALLVVNNLSQFAQPCELDLRPYAGAVPVELLGNQEFPRVTERPYFLSLGAYSFYWFRLDRPMEAVTVPAASAEDAPGTTRPMPGERHD
jgi:maltose alpha-D-glucosyltransferase/alpha-amylase